MPYEANIANATPSSSSSMPLEQHDGRRCVVCLERQLSTELVGVGCRHDYCRDCINEMFEHASKHPPSFPPRCCGEPIALTLVEPFLRLEVVDVFTRKAAEHAMRNHRQCHSPNCRQLIPPSNIDGDRATCPDCGETTCTICNLKAHDRDCPEDPALGPLMATATEQGWRACYNCHQLIARENGCNHMTYVARLLQILPLIIISV